jgi:hypothetical protein
VKSGVFIGGYLTIPGENDIVFFVMKFMKIYSRNFLSVQAIGLSWLFIVLNSLPCLSQSLSHQLFTELLKKHVTVEGVVNYQGFIADSTKLNEYLDDLAAHTPADTWSKNEKLAYWINVYNAFTIRLIIRNYPIKSIKDIDCKVYKVRTPWDIEFIKLGTKKYSLKEIEDDIIREKFEEPRVPFALNHAAKGSPRLRNEAYVADRLNVQLTDQAKTFIRDPRFNMIKEQEAQLSKIFSWYRADFALNMSFEAFINQWSPEVITPDTDISYMTFDWSLNE